MKGSKRIKTFTDRYPLVGPMFWIVSLQFFITQIIVGLTWPVPYSATQNTISDLGNSACGVYAGRYVCSPLFSWMNLSFMVLGITMVVGSILIYHEFRKSVGSAVGFSFMAASGVGTIIVGLVSENTISSLHAVGAALPFILGNLALLILGNSLDVPRTFRFYTILAGGISLTASALFITKHYFGLGIGGMERLAVHPQTIWLIIFGIYMSRSHFRALPASIRAKKP